MQVSVQLVTALAAGSRQCVYLILRASASEV